MIILTDQDYNFTLEALTQAAIIFSMAVAIILANLLLIVTFIYTRVCLLPVPGDIINCQLLSLAVADLLCGLLVVPLSVYSALVHSWVYSDIVCLLSVCLLPVPGDVINCYLLSLAVADLLCGLLVVPLSVYPALVHSWVYGDIVCRLIGYLEVTLWAVQVYTFMWISVDRYLAVRKPLRYETVQTKTRCQCWMAFTWISAAMMCCPPLLGFNQPKFDEKAFVCMLDWKDMAAYSVTLAILVLGPSLITIVYTYSYIFSMMRRLRSGVPIHDKEYATALGENLSNPSHMMSFVLILTFWLSWLPFIFIRMYEHWGGHRFNVPNIHFAVFWLGVLNSVWKALVLLILSPQFRLMLRVLCLTICCRQKGRLDMELMGLDGDD